MLNRIVAVLLAVALTLGGLLAAAEIVLAQVGRQPLLVPHEQWSAWLGERTLTDLAVRAGLIGVALLGLLLLLAGLRRGRPGELALPARGQGVTVTVSRRGLERTVARAARRADGVRDARVRAGRRAVKVKAETALRTPGDLQQRVTSTVTDSLAALGLDSTLRPRVTIKQESAR